MVSPPIHLLDRVVLGSFRLLTILGQGSFASAFSAEQVGTDRKAVVKIAHAHLIHSERGQMVRDRFAAEVRAATRVTHPNLVTIYTAGETDEGLPALAMEFLEGETLGQLLTRGDWRSIDEIHAAFRQLASALERVHASHIIHRDVSPENVFLTQGADGFAVKLLDFGIARLQDRSTGGKSIVGTPFYMAPEQMRGESTSASDVYSVGALLWWSLTGVELFSHITSLPNLIHHLQMQQEPPDPRTVCPSMPDGAAGLISAMLDHRPERRPSMTQFLREWGALGGELRAWRAARGGRQVAVFATAGAVMAMVTTMLQQQGHTVLQHDARLSSLLALPQLDAIVIDAGLSEPDPLEIARHAGQVLPHVPLCAVSLRPFVAAWSQVPVHALAMLPEQLTHLQDAIAGGATAEGAPASRVPTLSAEFAHLAIGEIPELLAGLEEAMTHQDHGTAVYLCERVERIAHLASLSAMGNLARTMRVLLEAHAMDDPAGFLDELQSSYLAAFPVLQAAQEG